MEHLQIDTAQNIALEYEIAGVGDRILAALLDTLVSGLYMLVMFYTFFELLPRLDSLVYLFFALSVIPFLGYHLLCEIFMNGQSFGKKALNIKVIKLDGSQAAAGDYFIRWILRIVDVALCSGTIAVITILFNGRGQRLGDIAAGTTVVKLRERVRLSDTMYQALDENYSPSFPQVIQLSDQDATVIKEVLELSSRENAAETLSQLDAHLRKVLGINPQLTPYQLAVTVLRDYNYYTGRT